MATPLEALLRPDEQAAIIAAIAAAEGDTAGEIKVHVEARCEGEAYARAVDLFGRLGMLETRGRTGVLIYVAAESHRFAIIGDTGVHAVVDEGFWTAVAARMTEGFRGAGLGAGILAGVRAVGELLHQRLPVVAPVGDEPANEIDDSISTGEPPRRG